MYAAEEWRGAQGRRWAKGAEAQDRFLAPFGEAALAALGPARGMRVLDLGCGAGATTATLAQSGAQVVGLDVSPELVAMTRARLAEADLAPGSAEAVEADAGRRPPAGPFDRLFSRFGCMFFDAPREAWTRLRAVMAPGARFTAVAWRGMEENEWASLGFEAHRAAVEAAGREVEPPSPPGAPGPFGWGEPTVVRPWLEGAGWREVAFAPLDIASAAVPEGDPDPVESAVARAMESGPVAGRLREADEALRAATAERLREVFAPRAARGPIRLKCAAWIVSAQA